MTTDFSDGGIDRGDDSNAFFRDSFWKEIGRWDPDVNSPRAFKNSEEEIRNYKLDALSPWDLLIAGPNGENLTELDEIDGLDPQRIGGCPYLIRTSGSSHHYHCRPEALENSLMSNLDMDKIPDDYSLSRRPENQSRMDSTQIPSCLKNFQRCSLYKKTIRAEAAQLFANLPTTED